MPSPNFPLQVCDALGKSHPVREWYTIIHSKGYPRPLPIFAPQIFPRLWLSGNGRSAPKLPSNLLYKTQQIHKLKSFSSRLSLLFAQSGEAKG